jgi:hypothetical protein
MISDRVLYTAASLMITQHGEYAVMQAAKRADECGADNDIDGRLHWIEL